MWETLEDNIFSNIPYFLHIRIIFKSQQTFMGTKSEQSLGLQSVQNLLTYIQDLYTNQLSFSKLIHFLIPIDNYIRRYRNIIIYFHTRTIIYLCFRIYIPQFSNNFHNFQMVSIYLVLFCAISFYANKKPCISPFHRKRGNLLFQRTAL